MKNSFIITAFAPLIISFYNWHFTLQKVTHQGHEHLPNVYSHDTIRVIDHRGTGFFNGWNNLITLIYS